MKIFLGLALAFFIQPVENSKNNTLGFLLACGKLKNSVFNYSVVFKNQLWYNIVMDIFTFFKQYNRKMAVPKVDGGYPGECVSLINQYCHKVLNVPAGAWGNAKDWATNSIQRNYFNLINGAPQVGDLIVWGGDYGGGYGHIAICAGNGKVFDQNGGAGTSTCGYSDEYPRRIAVLRPKNGLPNTIRRGVVIADVLNVRRSPTTKSEIVKDANAGIPNGTLKKDDVVVFKNQVRGEFYGVSDMWYLTRSGYYVASAYVRPL